MSLRNSTSFAALALLFVLICFISFHQVGATIDPKRAPTIPQHSFQTPFTVPNWLFQGSAYFRDHYIRLTPDRQSRIGGLWNAMPVYLDSWEAIIEFKIHGQGKTGADGLAFWYIKEKSLGNLFGVEPHFEGLGVVVDTYDNDGSGHHPRAMVLLSDGETEFSHDHNHEHAEGMERGGCAFGARQTGTTSLMKVIYNRNEQKLTLEVDATDSGVWKPCTVVEHVDLPTGYFFGFTAATGQLADNHDLYSFYVTNLVGPELAEAYNAEQYTLNGFQHTIERRMTGLQKLVAGSGKPSSEAPAAQPSSHSSQPTPPPTGSTELDNELNSIQNLVSNVQRELRSELNSLRTKLDQLSVVASSASSTPTPSAPATPAAASSSSSSSTWFIVGLLLLILVVLIRFQYQTKKELDKKLF